MSSMERNKGKLIPLNIDTENFTGEDLETCYENGQVIIDDEIFDVEWIVKGDTDSYGFADVVENEDGTIDFHTYHYNGGGDFSEVIGDELKRQFKEKYHG